ncbi:formylmethanofuran dehydrogenase subunit B [Beggiatoa alba B18LD]|uniref:Formylmethanofuran dehydrogenase subunit B n=1 Tax=Beggiatoa alba B18LD TaxID=395493 RepID=I3CHZ5_9GAMM|nr:hypothetical protein [Beggiatoa alba]EIJ43238.1 formylmethanofuran dehydrogenase subunit B [Beggiatoa alba B18LD]
MLATQHENVTCPFCALLCDDLQVHQENNQIQKVTHACQQGLEGFQYQTEVKPRIQGQIVSEAEATIAAVELLAKAKLPLYAGLGTDVAGIRAVLQLAEQTGGILDHQDSSKQSARTLAIQHSGYLTTTLTEVRNRADFMLWIGDGIPTYYPRLWERCAQRKETLFTNAPKQPSLIQLGGTPVEYAQKSFNIPLSQLPEVINGLRALLAGHTLQQTHIAGIPVADYQSLMTQMTATQYGVIVWQTSGLPATQTDLLINALYQLVKELNQNTRFAALPLGGSHGGVSALQVTTWHTGFPLRIGFKQEQVTYDVWQFDTLRLLEQGEIDTLIWLSSFSDVKLPKEAAQTPTILIANTYPQTLAFEPTIFLPISTPGIHHTGQLFRTDGVVSLPLKRILKSELPTAEAILHTLSAKLMAKNVDNV